MTTSAITAAHEISILSLGDSYTIGEGVREDDRWPVRLASELRAQGAAVATPTIIARTGWTTDELSRAIDEASPQGPFDLVTLLIGVNNQYRGRSTANYRSEFRSLLERAVGYAGQTAHRVVVLSIPDWSVTPFAAARDRGAIAGEIDLFNSVARDETRRQSASFVDVTPISRHAASDPDLIASDGLHPSARMYDEWTRLVLPIATDALGEVWSPSGR